MRQHHHPVFAEMQICFYSMSACLNGVFECKNRIFWIFELVPSMRNYLRSAPIIGVQAFGGESCCRILLVAEQKVLSFFRYFFLSFSLPLLL